MRFVTKYAMLGLLLPSFIALNNCGNHSGSVREEATSVEQGGPAADYMFYGTGAPLGYQGIAPYPVPFGIPIPPVPTETECRDGVDNDGDGLVDCMDSDCHVWPECSEFGPPISALKNSRALTIYPNGIKVPEDVVFLKARGFNDDDGFGWTRNNFFNTTTRDCWVEPRRQDPYYFIPMGEALIAGPDGPIGPQLFPESAYAFFGPRAGLIDVCGFGNELLFHELDDDNDNGERRKKKKHKKHHEEKDHHKKHKDR